jgi:hypothetical protein
MKPSLTPLEQVRLILDQHQRFGVLASKAKEWGCSRDRLLAIILGSEPDAKELKVLLEKTGVQG